NRKFAKDLLRAIAEFLPSLPAKMYFYTQVSLNVAKDEELLRLFHEASFLRLFIGIETSDSDQLININKKHNVEQDILHSIKTIQSYGITVWAGILFGLDGDSEQSYEKQYQFIMESGITPVQMGLLQAMPDTPLYDRVIEEGRLIELPQIMGASGLGDGKNIAASNIMPDSMAEHDRDFLFARTIKRLYAPDAFAQRILDAEARVNVPTSKVWPALSKTNIAIVGRTLAYYLFKTDRQCKRMFFRMFGAFFSGKVNNLEELLFNLIIYKHLRTFYFNLADSIISNQDANRNENISDQS
ncbi:MAG: radical SAM protein, partial [Gammaproteobacteria bacterium]|nr:radical SAM protein [Gammaproteobacteria bacterium]